MQRAIEENHAGGFMLGTRMGAFGIERGQPYATAAMINLLQKSARIPLLFAADFERGTAMRLEEGTSFPHAMAVAAAGRPAGCVHGRTHYRERGAGRGRALDFRARGGRQQQPR